MTPTIAPDDVLTELADDLRYIAAHEADPRKEDRIYEAADAITTLLERERRLREALATYDCGKRCGYLKGKHWINGRCPRDFEGACGKVARAALTEPNPGGPKPNNPN